MTKFIVCRQRVNCVCAAITGEAEQWCSQKIKKFTHIKGRLLDEAAFLFNCFPFHNGISLKGKNLLPERANSFL